MKLSGIMSFGRQIIKYAGAAVVIGATVGVVTTEEGRQKGSAAVETLSAATDMRVRPPQAGDYWQGCDDARAAGTEPIYLGEPGYREGMDGDHDGIACEPYH